MEWFLVVRNGMETAFQKKKKKRFKSRITGCDCVCMGAADEADK
jgi:hypothetical protein